MAVGPDGSVYLLDVAKLALKRFDPCTCGFEAVRCIGGEGGEGRQWRNAHGIAICGADLYVCDTGLADATAGDPASTSSRCAHECEPKTTASACLR